MGYVNWLWGGDETKIDPRPMKVVVRDHWFGGLELVKVPDYKRWQLSHDAYDDEDGAW